MFSFQSRFAIIAVGVLSAVAVGGAGAQSPVTGVSTQTSISTEARVTAVDPASRTATLVTPDGRTITGKVGDAVRNLDQVKPGDIAVISYEERTSYVLSERGAKLPTAGNVVVSARAAKGEMPAAGVIEQALANFTVIATNVQANTITLVNTAGGPVRTYNVTTDIGRAALPRVKPGNVLTAIDRQTLIGRIERRP